MAKKVKFSSEQRYKYHSARQGALEKYGLEFGGTKHMYSSGFTDAFHGIDNTKAVKGEFGVRCSRFYALGRAQGRKCAMEYLKRTGNPPSILNRYDD